MYVNLDKELEEHVIRSCTKGELSLIVNYLKSHEIDEFLSTGWTLLLYAASEAQSDIVDYLVKNGADVNKHRDGFTPLMALCNCTSGTTEKRIKCLTLLISLGADVDAINKHRQTALMLACASQGVEFVVELLKHVKNLNARDYMKQTALMYATMANRYEIVKALIDKGADVTVKDWNDCTAKDIALTKGYTRILPLVNYMEEVPLNNFGICIIESWKDMFPSLTTMNEDGVDTDVANMLYAMHLDSYASKFRGINLKAFLRMTESKLNSLGVDIRAHRAQLMEYLHRFHRKEWSIHSLGTVNRNTTYTLYDGMVSLGITAKQLAVIGSSFMYVKSNILESFNDTNLIEKHAASYKEEIGKALVSLNNLEKELERMRKFCDKARKGNEILSPTYIGPKNKRKTNWPMFLSITLIGGICLFKIYRR